MRNKPIIATALVVMLLAAGLTTTVVLAQGPTPTPPRANLAQLFLQALANKFGVSVPTLQQNFADARKDALNQAVKQGLITQAQADKMLQRLQNAPATAPFNFRSGAKFGFQKGLAKGAVRGFLGPDVLEQVASSLNMKPADVTAALKAGKTLADLAKQQQVDEIKVKTAIVNAEKAALDRAVKDGLVTQAAADKRKANLDPNKIDLTKKLLGRGLLIK